MQLILLACILGLAAADPVPLYSSYNYHERIGIKTAARLDAAEKATDFDGSRIVGGSGILAGVYPYMAGLSITLRTGFLSVCGATLLSNTRAVTAAHCWWDGRNQARQLIVILGTVTFSSGTRITTNVVNMHPNWDPKGIENDIAVITFPWVIYTIDIRPIGLPSGTQLTNDFIGLHPNAVGYGLQTDAGTITLSQPLRHVPLEVIENTLCRLLYGPAVTDVMICARGRDGRSTCDGDNGGPLSMNHGDLATLIGVNAFNHHESCQLGYPVVFTRVTTHVEWLRQFLLW